MLKLRSGNMAVIGLSEMNLEELKKGRSIPIPSEALGFAKGAVFVVMYGKTEADIVAELERSGRFKFEKGPQGNALNVVDGVAVKGDA